jgi:Fur family ferric uptake transcriptional regulator
VILEELKKVTSHPTADEVYEMVRQVLPHISLGTVYRNLEILSETGVIQKLEMAGTQKRFDGNAMNHYHIRCMGCGRVDDLPMEPIQEVENYARGVGGYKILGYRIEFVGLCPECLKEQPGR